MRKKKLKELLNNLLENVEYIKNYINYELYVYEREEEEIIEYLIVLSNIEDVITYYNKDREN